MPKKKAKRKLIVRLAFPNKNFSRALHYVYDKVYEADRPLRMIELRGCACGHHARPKDIFSGADVHRAVHHLVELGLLKFNDQYLIELGY